MIEPTDVAICVADDELPKSPSGGTPANPPIVQTSTFTFPTFEDLLRGLSTESRSHVYSRGLNPTVEALERKLARLERGEACKCFGSGMAAISAVMLGLLEAGDHVLFVNHTYGPTLQLAEHLRRFGIEHDLLLELEPEAAEAALRPNTRLVWLESPGTMMMRVLDIDAVAAVARDRGILTCIDNSWATPLYQKPLAMGVDIAVHTASKYLGGHSDVIAGAVVTTAERMEQIFYRAFLLNGGVLGPVDAWLLLRGLRTLPVRMRQHEADALRVAEFLRSHPAVRRVHYPAFADDPDLVARQLTGLSGLLSFELAQDDFGSVSRVIDRMKVARIGVSWGGVESLVISPNRGTNAEALDLQGIPPGLIRLSVGLEGAGLLIDDLDSALSALG
ncbi:MAG: aminotransferase class I/II-fold pyridoxal phosphate-dependent enzyme [Candidatus Palauibacterales bacterium]|nr:aminotransferase class I/II-fold pyridoxal phosphate-dependent enzyme [Candidatus Palauibacterales bacterium]